MEIKHTTTTTTMFYLTEVKQFMYLGSMYILFPY